jgi:hypothetical protein
MTMDANELAETVLLFDSQKRLIPASTSAFKISHGPKRQIDQLYKDSLIIYRNGTVRKIDRIEFLGFWGATIGQRLLSAANGGIRRVELDLTDAPQGTLERIKGILCDGLTKDRELVEPFFSAADSLPDVLRRVNEATTCAEIFDAIRMPSPEDALDILC